MNPPSLIDSNLSAETKADLILISKTERKLYLFNQGRLLKQYPVSFGFGYADGPKVQEGDGRTPEGVYKIESKRSKSNYHLALKVSYPNQADINNAQKLSVRPGGNILIHGFPSRPVDGLIPEEIQKVHALINWTQGCIAVTDQQIEEIYAHIQVGTSVEICPLDQYPGVL
jgi:murein L,D-transpeptidase YafK